MNWKTKRNIATVLAIALPWAIGALVYIGVPPGFWLGLAGSLFLGITVFTYPGWKWD